MTVIRKEIIVSHDHSTHKISGLHKQIFLLLQKEMKQQMSYTITSHTVDQDPKGQYRKVSKWRVNIPAF